MKRYLLALGTFSCALTPKLVTATAFKFDQEDADLKAGHNNEPHAFYPTSSPMAVNARPMPEAIKLKTGNSLDDQLRFIFQHHGFKPPATLTPYTSSSFDAQQHSE